MKYIWIIPFLFVSSLSAEIYRWTDENGNIIFSDESHPNAEIVVVPPPPTYTPPVIIDEPEVVQKEIVRYSISVTSPEPNQALWANDGNVPVSVDIQPALKPKSGMKILVKVDGEIIGDPQQSNSFSVPITERGQHSVSVSLFDNIGQTIATSDTVVFQLHRPSTNKAP